MQHSGAILVLGIYIERLVNERVERIAKLL